MQPNFKDYFYFSRSEKRGVTVLLTILIVLLLFNLYFPYPGPEEQISEDLAQKLIFKLDSIDQVKEKNRQALYAKKKAKKTIFKLKEFNPNLLSDPEWQNLGLSKKQSKTILNYLNKGGQFRIKSDLAKMYSISKEEYQQLKPYILLPDTFEVQRYKKEKFEDKKWVPEIIAINSADSATFKKLRGIGPAYASRIIKYRNQLGGFHSIKQLSEVYGVSDSLVNTFQSQLQLDSIVIQKIDINSIDAKGLKVNPYIDWNVANSIVNYRKQHGLYKNIEEIMNSAIIDDSLFQKLKPYIHIVK